MQISLECGQGVSEEKEPGFRVSAYMESVIHELSWTPIYSDSRGRLRGRGGGVTHRFIDTSFIWVPLFLQLAHHDFILFLSHLLRISLVLLPLREL